MLSKEEEKNCEQALKDLSKRYRKGLKEFRSLRNAKAHKWWTKHIKPIEKKSEYVGYRYDILPCYFTSRPDFYYEFDINMAGLLHDLLRNYYILANSIFDLDEGNERKDLKKIIKYLKNYEKTRDKYDFKSPEEMKEFYAQAEKKRKKIFKRLGKIFIRLGI